MERRQASGIRQGHQVEMQGRERLVDSSGCQGSIVYVHMYHSTNHITVWGYCTGRVSGARVPLSLCFPGLTLLQYRVKVPGYCARAAFRSVGEVVLPSADHPPGPDCQRSPRGTNAGTSPSWHSHPRPLLHPRGPPRTSTQAFPNQPRIPNCDQLSLMIRGSIVASVTRDFVYPLPFPSPSLPRPSTPPLRVGSRSCLCCCPTPTYPRLWYFG